MAVAVVDKKGMKRICTGCGARFYDFNKRPIKCPGCDLVFTGENKVKTRRGRAIIPDDEGQVDKPAKGKAAKTEDDEDEEEDDSSEEESMVISLDDVDESDDDEDDLVPDDDEEDLEDIDDLDDEDDLDDDLVDDDEDDK